MLMAAKWYTDAELQALLREPESELVERKSGFDKDGSASVLQTVCAFANDYPEQRKPGVIFIGADNKNGTPLNECIEEALLNQLAALGEDPKFSAPLAVHPTRLQCGGKQVAALQVAPVSSPPVKFRQRVYIRVGASTRQASYEQEIRLSEMRLNRHPPFDISPVQGASLKDLDMHFFREKYLPAKIDAETLKANKRGITAQLAVEKMIVRDEGEQSVPTVLGVLVLGYRPQNFLPGAYVQFLRIDSDAWDDPADEAVIDGTILEITRRLREKLRTHNRVRVEYTKVPVEKRHWLYPETALLQIAYNAIMHRRYEDTNAPVRVYWFNNRIEIDNPGGLHGEVRANLAKFPDAGCDYRNLNLAEAMKTLNLVQKFGSGLGLAQQELEKNGNPPMEWKRDSLETHVHCILRPANIDTAFRLSLKTITSLAQFLELFGKSGHQLLGKHSVDGSLTDGDVGTILTESQPNQLRGLLGEIGRTKTSLQRQMIAREVEKERRELADEEDHKIYKSRVAESREVAKAVFAERWKDLQICLREDGFRFSEADEPGADELIEV